jgi:Kyakuja-Dileera-Zisupton transposase
MMMISSAKYPLAIVNRLIDILGKKVGCAYDIGCAFATTLKHSSLAEKAKDASFRLMVGAFHGHAHNRLCQLSWHPLYIDGAGRTDGEGCEQVFSSSNDLARSTRHATRFHRHQSIEEHFNFWDQDKYGNLSTWR